MISANNPATTSDTAAGEVPRIVEQSDRFPVASRDAQSDSPPAGKARRALAQAGREDGEDPRQGGGADGRTRGRGGEGARGVRGVHGVAGSTGATAAGGSDEHPGCVAAGEER